MTVISCPNHQLMPAATGWRRLADLRWLNLLLAVLTVALFVGYLAINNRAAASGFALRGLEQQIVQLEETQRQLELQTLGQQAMRGLEGRAQELGFVPVDAVQYLTAAGGVVALR